MIRPRLLDTYCGAGGCSMGYYRAGFDVIGVDIEPQPHYPFPFILGDALDILRRLIAGKAIQASDGKWYTAKDFDAFSASPPCHRFSVMTKRWGDDIANTHINLIPATRAALRQTGKPYIIENVEGARAELVRPVMLCGTMFGLELADGSQLRRHRYFECWGFEPGLTSPCWHNNVQSVLVVGHSGGRSTRDGHVFHSTDERRVVMDIDWMTGAELSQAIPPAYTEWIGRRLLAILQPPQHPHDDAPFAVIEPGEDAQGFGGEGVGVGECGDITGLCP